MCLKLTHAQVNTLKRSTSKKSKSSAKKVKSQVKVRALPVLNSTKKSELQLGGLNRELLRGFTEFMREEGLASFTFKSKDFEVELKFASSDVSAPASVVNPPVQQTHNRSIETPASFAVATEEKRAPAPSLNTRVIKSPFVGTFYRSSGPGKPPFVEVGKVVSAGDALCILEAMKLMNEIEAEYRCKIVKILVEDSSPVEYGESLFEVEAL